MPRIIEVWHNGDSRIIHIQIAICVWTIFALFTRDRMQIMDLRAGWGIRFRENAKVEAVFEELSPWIAPWAAKQDDVPFVLKRCVLAGFTPSLAAIDSFSSAMAFC